MWTSSFSFVVFRSDYANASEQLPYTFFRASMDWRTKGVSTPSPFGSTLTTTVSTSVVENADLLVVGPYRLR